MPAIPLAGSQNTAAAPEVLEGFDEQFASFLSDTSPVGIPNRM